MFNMSRNQAKKKLREERIRRERHLSAIRSLYPPFEFINEHLVSPEYAKAVRRAVAAINFQKFEFSGDNDFFHGFLKQITKIGYKGAYIEAAGLAPFLERFANYSRESLEKNGVNYLKDKENRAFIAKGEEFASLHERMVLELGDNILNSDKEMFVRSYPEYGFRICMVGSRIGIVFQRIFTHFDVSGKYHQYMLPGSVERFGKRFNIVFKAHALERIRERYSSCGTENYGSYVLLYEFFQHFRTRVVKINGYDFVQFYIPMFRKLDAVAEHIVATDPNLTLIDGSRPKGECNMYLKAFMSPFDCVDSNMHMITALLQGFHPTREFYWFSEPSIEHMKLKDKVRQWFFGKLDLNSPEFHESLKIFHEHVEPQLFFEPAKTCRNPFGIRNYYDATSHIPDHIPA